MLVNELARMLVQQAHAHPCVLALFDNLMHCVVPQAKMYQIIHFTRLIFDHLVLLNPLTVSPNPCLPSILSHSLTQLQTLCLTSTVLFVCFIFVQFLGY